MKEGYAYCPCCKADLPLGDFSRDRSRRTGRCAFCKKCRSEKRRLYSAKKRAVLIDRLDVAELLLEEQYLRERLAVVQNTLKRAGEIAKLRACRSRPPRNQQHVLQS